MLPQSYSAYLFRTARTYGEKKAVIHAETGQSWTFSEITSSIERMSSALKKRGLKYPDVVSLVLDSTVEVVLAQFAVLATGATVSFAKPAFTAFELLQQFKGCKPRFVFTTASLLDKILGVTEKVGDSCGERVFVVDDTVSTMERVESLASLLEDDGSAACLFDETVVQDGKQHVAYLPYSSGTTGPPKGVMCSHYSFIYGLMQDNPLDPEDVESVRVAVQLPLFHISGVVTIGHTLYEGFTAVILPDFEPRTFLTYMSQFQINTALLVPHMCFALVNFTDIEKFDLSALRLIRCGGSPLSADMESRTVSALRRAHSPASVLQAYGLTESVSVPVAVPRGPQRLPNKEGSAGVVRPNYEVKIVMNENGERSGQAREVGEIWIRHPGIMLGYWNRKAATDDAITASGWLKSGDLGYFDEDGYLFIVGRKKEMFHCDGNQVSPAEIEGVLLSHPEVSDAGVVGVRDQVRGEVAMAFVVRLSESLTENELHNLVADKLAPWKHLYGGVRFVDKVPRNVTGKVLRHELFNMTN